MSEPPRHVNIYLHDKLRKRAQAGQHNFLAKLEGVLRGADFTVEYHNDDLITMIAATEKPGYSVVLMDEPVNERGVTVRLNYLYPFWHIERTAQRWDWPVAQAAFDPDKILWDEADRFCSFRRSALFGSPLLPRFDPEGFVYVPLQGQLLRRRSFQLCSPIEMIKEVVAHVPDREIVLTLHPKETYLGAERAELSALLAEHPQLRLSEEDMRTLLPRCSFVVTQNSSVALQGFFLHKPAVLFGRSNFHHIAADVHRSGIAEAFEVVTGPVPEFDKYLWWFFHEMSVNAAAPDTPAQITGRLRRAGWPV